MELSAIKKLQFVNKYPQTEKLKKIFELSMQKKNDDLIFIDKSRPDLHLSFHFDDEFISIKANESKSTKTKAIRLAKISLNEIRNSSGITPLLIYKPIQLVNYPDTLESERRYCKFISEFNDENFNRVVYKIFLINNTNKVPKRYSHLHNIRGYGVTRDGKNAKIQQSLLGPIRIKDNLRIWPEINLHKSTQNIDKLHLIILAPIPNVDIDSLLKKVMIINADALNEGKLSIVRIEERITCLAY